MASLAKIRYNYHMNKKAIVLLSGGLDSILAAKLILEQGVEIVCVNYYIDFASCGGSEGKGAAAKAARELGVPLKVFDITSEYLEVFKKPKHGYGANINPCIDCKIFMLKKAREYMAEVDASFLITGEVLGERPMSQRKDALNIIEKQAGVRGILLRPLSAKLLTPTIPEKEGIINREELLDISGRGRAPQMALARKFGIKEYPTPAGGCLLTDPGFTKRVKDLFKHDSVSVEELKLLKFGRHFRLSKESKLVVGRDKADNEAISNLAKPDDIIFKLKDHQGPLSLLRGKADEKVVTLAASIAAYHTKFRDEKELRIDYWPGSSATRTTISVKPATQHEIEAIRI